MNIPLENSIYQNKEILKNCATKSRAIRQAYLERSKCYNALRENWYDIKKAALESKLLRKEADKLCGDERELKLLEAERKLLKPVEYETLAKNAITKFKFFDEFLNQNGFVSDSEFELEEETYFKCKKLLDFCEKNGREVSFTEESLRLEENKQLKKHFECIESYSEDFKQNILPNMDFQKSLGEIENELLLK